MKLQPVPAGDGAQRRSLLAHIGWVAAWLSTGALPSPAHAAVSAFAATDWAAVFAALGGTPQRSGAIVLDMPKAVENGAFVPVTVRSALPGTSEICIVVTSNPNPLAVQFRIPAATDPFVSTRIKMAASGEVFAVVRVGSALHYASVNADVTVGGCG